MSCWFCERYRRSDRYIAHRHIKRPEGVPLTINVPKDWFRKEVRR